jgi:hypothetical protein
VRLEPSPGFLTVCCQGNHARRCLHWLSWLAALLMLPLLSQMGTQPAARGAAGVAQYAGC